MAPDLPDARTVDLLERQVERYQAIVARLANNGVQVKTWCVTAVGALSAVGVNNHEGSLFGVALAVLALFMLLDVQYLWLERRFREGMHALVGRVARAEVASMEEFFKVRPPTRGERGSVAKVVTSFTILPFYLPAAALLVIGLVTV